MHIIDEATEPFMKPLESLRNSYLYSEQESVFRKVCVE